MTTKNQEVPIPLKHLAVRARMSIESIRQAIIYGRLQAVEAVLDRALETKLVPYVPRLGHKRQGQALYVLPDEVKRFLAKREEGKVVIERPEKLTPDLEQQIVEAAQEARVNHPQGKVVRQRVLKTLEDAGHKQRDLYHMIRYVLDQHTEEFPPEHPNLLGSKKAARQK